MVFPDQTHFRFGRDPLEDDTYQVPPGFRQKDFSCFPYRSNDRSVKVVVEQRLLGDIEAALIIFVKFACTFIFDGLSSTYRCCVWE